ncbi:FHA domain-containing protein [Microcoleus sp. FACHB-1515]|uniref:FHA domain-containing protein n=1 Tax=Cyanophyceae TaxID=3028117 RepID=UPI001686BD8C|nr:FHA domain-containing protein [Microcoleus sp. FACHB-1515]MBD2092996.1 FHA domain-containing protein [Microcoleus sp. FACHB-1515]
MLKIKSVNFEQQQFQTHQLEATQPDRLEWMIGRNPSCDVVLANLEVSRIHGQIVYRDEAYYFTDVGSTSGSVLNGEIIAPNETRPLQAGDLLQIGETFLHVEEVTPPAVFEAAIAPVPPSDRNWMSGELVCRCLRIIDETPDVKTFCFIAEPPVLFDFQPGQFINLEVEINGKPAIRPYSISSSPTRPYHLAITVKRVPAADASLPPGLVSNWLHEHLNVGDRVRLLDRPMGNFTCLPNLPPKLLLISAGSGITPMMSMSRWVQDTLSNCDIVFLHSARTPNDIVFRTELETMATQMPNFHLAVTLTRPAVNLPWMGLTGRISQAMLNWVVPDLLDRAVFVCGPNEFMQSIKSTLQAMDFPMRNYQEESFGGKKATPRPTTPTIAKPPLPATNGNGNGKVHAEALPFIEPQVLPPRQSKAAPASPAVSFTRSSQEVSADGTSSILELAEQSGVSIRSGCRVGACGACKVRSHEGQVRYDSLPTALSATDQQAGYVLACVAYPVDRVVVEA